MIQPSDTECVAAREPESMLIDAMLCNGIDALAVRRAHLREITMARQAAERHLAKSAHHSCDAPERALEYRAEMARINATDRAWREEHGETTTERLMRRRRVPRSA